MIKARPCAGDIAAGEALLTELAPFVWRKHLDFAAIADVHAMKRQIHAYRGHGEIAVEGHNIKLGRGGIREIEFFVQTQQLIAGGRHPNCAGAETLATLDALAEGDWIDAEPRATNSTQAYLLPAPRRAPAADGRRRADPYAARRPRRRSSASRASSALTDRDAFAEELLGASAQRAAPLRQAVRGRAGAVRRQRGADVSAGRPTIRETLDRLAALGFSKPLEVSAIGARLARAAAIARCAANSRARSSTELVPVAARQLARTDNPDAARSAPSTASSPALQRRRAAVLAAAAEPRSGRAGRAHARHRAAARRHPGAAAAGDGRADRSALLRRVAGRRASLRAGSPRSLRTAESYEDFLDRVAAVRPGAHVPDRHAHPVRHGVGRAGRRRLRRGSPRCSSARCIDAVERAVRRASTAASQGRRPRCSRWASSAAAR